MSTEPKYRKWTGEDRKRVYGRMIQLAKAGLNSGEISAKMAEEGFKGPGGVELLRKHIENPLSRFRLGNLGEYERYGQSNGHRKSAKLPSAVVEILTNPELNDTQRVRMIAAYAELEL